MGSPAPLQPTFYGHIASTQDALLLFEACLQGTICHVARRPHDRERAGLIRSGNVFIYEEHSSGIKRWTDGVPWSPSRILGNFLIYRELERPFPPGEKKRAMKKPKRPMGAAIAKPNDPYGKGTASSHASLSGSESMDGSSPVTMARDTERQLIGSLVDSYGFKKDGLIKKTLSVTVSGISHHLVSYYNVQDVMENRLTTPSKEARFQHFQPRQDLITKQNFRTPIEEVDSMERDDRALYNTYPYSTSYDLAGQGMAQRDIATTSPVGYSSQPPMYSNYSAGYHDSVSGTHGNPASDYTTGFEPAISSGSMFGTKPDPDGGNYRFRSSMSTVASDPGSRGSLYQPYTDTTRRSSHYDTQHMSLSHGLPAITSTLSEHRMSTDPSQAPSYYAPEAPSRESHMSQYQQQRALPTPALQAPFDRGLPSTYTPVDTRPKLENLWHFGQPSGTTNSHHHYTPQAHQWTASGA